MQHFAILSINHHLAPIAMRERVAFTQRELNNSLNSLINIDKINGCVILSTCNRSEIYVASSADDTQELLINYLANTHNIKRDELINYIDYKQKNAAIKHICSVATGIDSLILGETQILGQLKDAYSQAKQAKTLNKLLEKLFQHAFSTAKKARTETQIGGSPVSIAYCAFKLSAKIFADLDKQNVLFIGANEMIDLCAQYFNKKGVQKMIIANRTIANAKKIATPYNAAAINLKQLPSVIQQVDIIISSTSASVPIIGKGLIETALKARKHKPMFILDIAVPRDVEPETGQLDDVFLYTIDDLQQVIDENVNNREKESILAKEIIDQENKKFISWLNNMPNEQVVQNYNLNANLIKETIVNNAINKLKNGYDHELIIKELADQLTNKLLHAPFKNIKHVTQDKLNQCENCVPQIIKTIDVKNS